LLLFLAAHSQLEGEHVRDVLDLGNDLILSDQVFVQITSYGKEQDLCLGMEGMLGLGHSLVTKFDFPSLIANLQQPNVLKHAMFSLYLDETDDDYPQVDPDTAGGTGNRRDRRNLILDDAGAGKTTDDLEGDDYAGGDLFDQLLGTDDGDEEGIDDYYSGGDDNDDDLLSKATDPSAAGAVIQNPDDFRPRSASSEIVFGGVNHQHYAGCLVWHDVAEIDGETSQWAIRIDSVQSSGKELASSSSSSSSSAAGGGASIVALIDTDSSYIAGPAKIIGQYLTQNQVECFNMNLFGDVTAVDCAGSAGFEVAFIDCDQPVAPLQFIAHDVTYEMAATDLLTRVDTSEGELCFLRLMGLYEGNDDTWIFGASFVNRYYTAFDFGTGRIGLAVKSTANTKNDDSLSEKCPEDWPLDINYDNVPLPPVASSPAATAPPPPVPTTTTTAKAAARPSPVPLTVETPAATAKSAVAPQKSSASRFATIGLPTAALLGAILLVVGLILSRRRRSGKKYKRADQDTTANSDDDYDEVELPDLL
jgi:Eukaryotic aspartyl protease